MAIIKETELGVVKVSNQVVAGIISDIMADPDMSYKIWPATEHGHRIGKKKGFAEIIDMGDSDLASNIEVSSDKSGNVTIEFSVIVKFGLSIKAITRSLADKIAESMHYVLGIKPSVIIINIAGVKSKQIARRNTRTIYKYESDDNNKVN